MQKKINPELYFIRIFFSEEDECFIAEVPELPGCSALGTTSEQALKEAKVAVRNWLHVAQQVGKPIPEPIQSQQASRLNLRLPADIIQGLKRSAKEMGMSLNQLLLRRLSAATP